MVRARELNYDTNASALEMADTIFGDGITVLDASYTGDSRSSAIYSNGDALAPGATPSDTGVILSTGRADQFTNSRGQANQDTNQSTNTWGPSNQADFNEIAGTRTYDASYLDVSFIPDSQVMTLQFVFSSEEFPEFQNSVYQDMVAVWVNGEPAQLEIAGGAANPANVSASINENLYLDNTSDDFNTEMDGLTVTMTLTMRVNPDQVNNIRIGIADVGDSSYDSNLLIAGKSGQTNLIAITDKVFVTPDGSKTIDILENDINIWDGGTDGADGSTLTVTHINGVAVTAGSVVTLPSGQQVTLNEDGTITLAGDGDTEHFNFTYTVSNGTISDTGFVNASSIPCFVAGTLIRTPLGEVPVEDLMPGDLVETRDEGAQPLSWTGGRSVAAEGDFAPIRIAADTFGRHGALLVSPQHRVLVRGAHAELFFGEEEVLVAAKDLVNGRSVTCCPGGEVTYVHLMFDSHQVIYSEGLETESFLPGPQIVNLFEQAVAEEICALFPELDPETGAGYSAAARPALKSYEGQLLAATQAA
ncbi:MULTISPECIES: Hint domain-containing protein [unclassified Leisingera]|uniref:Hint domain-containing protein n=1 Tax=unclassified Leisingera TaxID=2614906 RepID=UPI0002F0AC15|nr:MULTISPECIES: Hint domain-containing protein [unclassified Leisingera]KIC24232.1 2,3,4,5-tetrahydropyridine-2,6-carboxylate N-succinyltransferase [Leisingera sp. ANG-S3]KIC26959.1 2,3,4,5-tetrahydropyridine-2,6-carboxylate N-succinyltransferase [Leisingera sp. ANG-M6]KIC52948.1 2,3,4,5-tetrahydropyridine-2,6-carboxylate N-succinyltransferase [Leisingera sp. ANG-S]KID07348.1 2,3,4,5-tetrahydropyridine-2,6-carboxylate N-succinyltransferase [Leisingera sp. ANG1]